MGARLGVFGLGECSLSSQINCVAVVAVEQARPNRLLGFHQLTVWDVGCETRCAARSAAANNTTTITKQQRADGDTELHHPQPWVCARAPSPLFDGGRHSG